MKGARDEEFRVFVRGSRPGLVRTAVLLTAGDAHLAEDLVQSTLTSLYLSWPAYRKAANPASYVRRCLVNALIDEKRRPWRRESTTDEVPETSSPADRNLPFDDVHPDQRTEVMYAALRELPPRMRAVLVLRYFHDLSVEDTAAALSCSGGTVKSQAKRALDKLRLSMTRQLSTRQTLNPHGAYNA